MDAKSHLKLECFPLDHKPSNLPKWRLLEAQNPYKVADSKAVIIVVIVLICFKIKEIGRGRVYSVHLCFSSIFCAPLFRGGK